MAEEITVYNVKSGEKTMIYRVIDGSYRGPNREVVEDLGEGKFKIVYAFLRPSAVVTTTPPGGEN